MAGTRKTANQLLDAATQAARIAATDRSCQLRFGIVDAVHTGPGTVDVTVAGTLLYDIPYMGLPVADGPAWLLHQGSIMVCIGPAVGAEGDPGQGVPAGGSAGEVLAKINGTDFNTEWVPQSGGINPSIVDQKGDLLAASAADTVVRLAVGTNGHVLIADSTATAGVAWGANTGSTQNPGSLLYLAATYV
jgi:hypothetical protein